MYLSVDHNLVVSLRDYSDWIFNEPNIYLTTRKIGDRKAIVNYNARKFEFSVGFNYFTGLSRSKADFIFPYTMHPGFYRFGHIKNIHVLRSRERKINMVFIGAVNIENYEKRHIRTIFDTIPRWSVVQHLLQQCKQVCVPKDLDDLDNKIKTRDSSVILCITSNFMIPQARLPEYYGISNFHLALPGVVMPMSHNIIESMSVGCIPVLQNHDLFHPALENGKNCLVYKSLEELERIIVKCADMSQLEIQKLREGVLQYYDCYLSLEGFGRSFTAFLENDATPDSQLVWNAEHESVRILQSQ